MLIRLERVEAQHDVTVLDAQQTFAISKDLDAPIPTARIRSSRSTARTAFRSLALKSSCTAGSTVHADR